MKVTPQTYIYTNKWNGFSPWNKCYQPLDLVIAAANIELIDISLKQRNFCQNKNEIYKRYMGYCVQIYILRIYLIRLDFFDDKKTKSNWIFYIRKITRLIWIFYRNNVKSLSYRISC